MYPNQCSAGYSPAERLRAAAYTVGGQQMQDTYDDWALVHGTDW